MKNEHHRLTNYPFQDRLDAGMKLGEKLYTLKNNSATHILAIPNGGVPVAAGIARTLNRPFALIPCQKMKHPANPKKTIGSVCQDEVILHPEREIPTDVVQHEVIRLKRIIRQKVKVFGPSDENLTGKTIILADDRLKNEDTLLACLTSITRRGPQRIIVAIPVISNAEMKNLKNKGFEVVTLLALSSLDKTHSYYKRFEPITEHKIHTLIRQSETSAGRN